MNDPKAKAQASLKNLKKAFGNLNQSCSKPPQNQLELAGTIKNFEFTYELTWKTLKKLLEVLGRPCGSPRDVFSAALEAGLIGNETLWLSMIEDRNLLRILMMKFWQERSWEEFEIPM